MFTGIIERTGRIEQINKRGSNRDIWVTSDLSNQLKIDQSVSHNGVCLTVVDLQEGKHCVTAIHETLKKSNLGALQVGDTVNLERCMRADGRFDGHIVQGHVDQTAQVLSREDDKGSWLFRIQYDPTPGHVTVEKGSITVNGVSLTVFDSSPNAFSVAIIPYTFDNTNFKDLQQGDTVNLEFDILGKYVERLLKSQSNAIT